MKPKGRPPLPPELKRVPMTFKLRKVAAERIRVICKLYGMTQAAVIEAAVAAYKPPGKR